jgi:hypothetical protein
LFFARAEEENKNKNISAVLDPWICSIWLGKVSVNATEVVLKSINTHIEFYFLPLHVVAVCHFSSMMLDQAIIIFRREKFVYFSLKPKFSTDT